MKIFGKKSITVILYWLFFALSILLFGLFLYNLTLPLIEEDISAVYKDYRFKDESAIISFHRSSVFRLLFLSFYFFMISLIFKNVKAETLFSNRVINLLKFFAVLNFLPFFYSMIYNITTYGEGWFFEDAIGGNLAYITTGFFSLFMANVFKQGYKIQLENELTI